MMPDEVKQEVRALYGNFAETVLSQEGQAKTDYDNYAFCRKRYSQAELSLLPPTALRLACGCSNPVSFADIRPGGSVVDLGCGGGVDVVLAAHKVEEHGKVLGIDSAPEMIVGAKQAVAESGLQQRIFFRNVDVEDIFPLPKNFADVVLAHCIISLCPDKTTVYKNIFRILRPGGILVVSDLVLTGEINADWQERLRSRRIAYLSGVIAEEEHLRILRKLSFDLLRVERSVLAAEELETIASYPGRAFLASPDREDLLFLHDKVAVSTFMGKRRPLN